MNFIEDYSEQPELTSHGRCTYAVIVTEKHLRVPTGRHIPRKYLVHDYKFPGARLLTKLKPHTTGASIATENADHSHWTVDDIESNVIFYTPYVGLQI